MAGKKLAIEAAAAAGAVATDKVKKFTTITVREAFERVTVPAGQDAIWEEVKPPSTLQVRRCYARPGGATEQEPLSPRANDVDHPRFSSALWLFRTQTLDH